jgi:hypothetical protein
MADQGSVRARLQVVSTNSLPPSGHNLAVVTDDPEQCICPFDTNKLWLQWERTRVYNCTLHCKSHVFSDKKDHEHKYRYDQICPTQGEVLGS